MPTTIEIPDEALDDLKKVVEPNDATFDSLLTAIRETPPTLSPRQFPRKVAQRFRDLAEHDLQAILRVAFNLTILKVQRSMPLPPEELARGVANSSAVSESSGFSAEQKKKLSERLTRLLGLDSVVVTAKAADVMTEHERVFCHARILSDIRPVFADGPEAPSAAVIVHNLQVGFRHEGRHSEIYVALDADDLKTLKGVIERAEKKAAALEAVLKTSRLPCLQV